MADKWKLSQMSRADLEQHAFASEERADRLQAELDTVITAHKQQVSELTDALSPAEWEPGRVPTEPGWYLWREGTGGSVLNVDTRDGELMVVATPEFHFFMARQLSHYASGRWLGPVVLPSPRPETDIDSSQVQSLGEYLQKKKD